MFAVAAAAFPLILGDVDGDAIEVGGELGVAAELGQGTEEAQKDLLGEVFDVRAGAGEPMERAKDKALVLADERFKAFRRCPIAAHAVWGGMTARVAESFTGRVETFREAGGLTAHMDRGSPPTRLPGRRKR